MGFFFEEEKRKKSEKGPRAKKQNLSKIPLSLLREQGCKVCSLRDAGSKSQGINPSGDTTPLVYVLGEMPSAGDVRAGKHFKGEIGSTLRKSMKVSFPDLFPSKKDLHKTEGIRFNYCVKCPTTGNAAPTTSEILCCRKSIEEDIEKTKPFAIIGLGPIALKWAINVNGIDMWRGRKIPIKVGNHHCWYFPIQTPALLKKKANARYKNEFEKAFDMDLQKAADFIMDEDSPEAIVYDKDYEKGITLYHGKYSSEVEKIREELEKMKYLDSVGIDIETDRLKPYGAKDAKILTIAIGTFDHTIAFPVDHPKAWLKDSDRKEIRKILYEFLLTCRAYKAAHNTKFELIWFLHSYDEKVLRSGRWADTMAQGYTIDNRTTKHNGMLSLNILCLLHFGFQLKPLSNINVKDLLSAKLEDVLRYNALDTKWTHKLFENQDALIEDSQRWTYDHLVRAAVTLAVTESAGVVIDHDQIGEFAETYGDKVEDIQKELATFKSVKEYNKKYGNFNPASPDDVVRLFKNILGLKAIKGTSGDENGFGTDNIALKAFGDKGHDEAPAILEYRENAKLLSTYIDPLFVEDKKYVVFPDGMLHADYNHLFTSTGRTSSENPNMQNFPKRKNKEIRSMIVPSGDDYMACIDYGQLEARIIAMASQDKVFCEAIENDLDVHMDWAEIALKYHPQCAGVNHRSDLDAKDMLDFRGRIKNELVFPMFFGSSIFTVARSLGMPDDKAQKMGKQFWDMFKGVKKWQAKVQKFYDKHGYVETLTGARRQGPLGYNEMINAPIQGTGSFVVNDGMNRLSQYAYDEGKSQFVARMNIHDDLTFYLPGETLEEDLLTISEKMTCTTFDFCCVPLAVEIEVGENWAETEAVATYTTNDFRKEVEKRKRRKRR